MNQINAAATSARESARSTDGKFGSYSTGEADGMDLSGPAADADAVQRLDPAAEGDDPDGWSPAYRSRIAGLTASWHSQDRHQEMDPTTGGCPPDRRYFTELGDEPGDFTAWSEDIANSRFEDQSPAAQDEQMLHTHRIEKAVRSGLDSGRLTDVADAPVIARDATEAGGADWADLTKSQQRRETAQVWHRMGLAPPLDPPAQQSGIAEAVAAHEAGGGVINVDEEQSEVAWRSGPQDDAPLYRACPDRDGAPAYFVARQPVAWMRGTEQTKSVYTDGSVRAFGSDGSSTYTGPDGSTVHFDADWAPHRNPVDGPAKVDADGALYAVHGEPTRHPGDGPARLSWDGEVTYFSRGFETDPTPEQMADHGVERYADAEPDNGWGTFAPPASGRYRAIGSHAGESDDPEPFDYTGHPLDWERPGPAGGA